MKPYMAAMVQLLAASMFYPNPREYTGRVLENGVTRTRHPWDSIHLSKAERKGKTFEELQELRKREYAAREAENPEGRE
jgi:hypothetical protein